MNVVVRESPTIFELLSGKDQALLVGRNAFFVLNFRLDSVDSVARLNLEGDGLAREGLIASEGADGDCSQRMSRYEQAKTERCRTDSRQVESEGSATFHVFVGAYLDETAVSQTVVNIQQGRS